jgi:RNA polymerase sigma-70 factor (ECF subfamily)
MTPFDAERLLEEGTRLRALARALASGAADADDLVQETWLRALQRPPRSGFAWRAWIAGLVRNVARERRRADTRRASHESAAPAASAPPAGEDPLEAAARFELLRRVLAHVDALDEPQRTTLIRRYFDGLEPAEIAHRDGISDATVRSRIKRGLGELRARLDAENGGDRRKWIAALLPWSPPAATVAAGVSTKLVGGLLMKTSTASLAIASAALLVLSVLFATRHIAPDASGTNRVAVAAHPATPPSPVAPSPSDPHRTADPVAVAVANEPGRFADAAPDREWRLEGLLHGLVAATPWTGRVKVEAVRLDLSFTVLLSDAPIVASLQPDGGFTAVLPEVMPGPVPLSSCRALKVTAEDPNYVDVETLVDTLDERGGARRGPCAFHVELTTQPSAHVHGRVVDENGLPLADVSVGWSDPSSRTEDRTTTSEASGRYALESGLLGPRTLYAWVEAPPGVGGWMPPLAKMPPPRALDELLPASAGIELRSGVDASLPDLILARGVAIRGLVVDAVGDPEPGAIVLARIEPRPPTGDPFGFVSGRVTHANDRGEFAVTGLRPGKWVLRVTGRAESTTHPNVGNEAGFGALEFVAPADDVELPDLLARVELDCRVGGAPAAKSPVSIQGFALDGVTSSVLGGTTDGDGHFRFLALPGTRYQVSCERLDVEHSAQTFTLAADGGDRVVPLDFEARHPRATLILKLHDPAGGTVARAWVKLEPRDDSRAEVHEFTPTSDDGSFVLGDVDLAIYHAVLCAGAGHFGGGGFFEAETIDVDLSRPERVEREISLHPTGRLTVRSIDREGAHVQAACRVVTREGHPLAVGFSYEGTSFAGFSAASTMEATAFVTPSPPPGHYRLEFTADGYVPQTIDAEVVVGQTTDVVVTMARH